MTLEDPIPSVMVVWIFPDTTHCVFVMIQHTYLDLPHLIFSNFSYLRTCFICRAKLVLIYIVLLEALLAKFQRFLILCLFYAGVYCMTIQMEALKQNLFCSNLCHTSQDNSIWSLSAKSLRVSIPIESFERRHALLLFFYCTGVTIQTKATESYVSAKLKPWLCLG